MKTIVTILSSFAAVCAAITSSGHSLDAAALFSGFVSSVIVGMFVNDYSAPKRALLVPAPTRRAKPARETEAGTEFATLAAFDTMML